MARKVKIHKSLVGAYWIAKARNVYLLMDTFGWSIQWTKDRPIPDDAWPIDIIAKALKEAHKAKIKTYGNKELKRESLHG